jgi:hypothetical protein
LRSQFLSVTFSVASCVCQDTDTSFFRIAASSELSLLSASDPFCSGSSSSSSSSNASILVCIVTFRFLICIYNICRRFAA